MVTACIPNFDSKSTEMEVIDDDVEPEKEIQMGVAKVAPVVEPIQLDESNKSSSPPAMDVPRAHARER